MNMTNRSPKAKLVVATQDTRRPTAHEILEGVSKIARDELARPTPPVDDPPDNPDLRTPNTPVREPDPPAPKRL